MRSKNLNREDLSKMPETMVRSEITIQQLEKDLESLRKKIFIYETLQAEKEIKKKQVKGPFRSGEKVIKRK